MASAYTPASLAFGTSTNIRLVELVRNASRGPITCKLHVVALDDHTEYTALSYVWGDDDPTTMKEIILDGRPFPVRENLWNFLHEARQSLFAGLLWIDAISIDQKNVHERNHQVAMMGAIYAKATLVVIWLGLETGSIARAIRELSDIRNNNREPADWRYFAQSIRAICVSEYWSRVWIVQEFVLARKVHVWWGMERLREECLFWLYHLQLDGSIMPRSSPSSAYRDVMDHTVHTPALDMIEIKLLRSSNRSYMRFTDLFKMSERQHCLDVRDRVYALLSLLGPQEREQLSIIPDYSKPASEFFKDLCAALGRCDTGTPNSRGWRLEYWVRKFGKMLDLPAEHEVVRRAMAECENSMQRVYVPELRKRHWVDPWTPIVYIKARDDAEPIGDIPEGLMRSRRQSSIQDLFVNSREFH